MPRANTSTLLLHMNRSGGHLKVTNIGHEETGDGKDNKTTGGVVMRLPSRSVRTFHQSRPFMPCAQCGDALFAPEWSEYLDDRHIRHLWSCDDCGYEFETLVRYPELRPVAA